MQEQPHSPGAQPGARDPRRLQSLLRKFHAIKRKAITLVLNPFITLPVGIIAMGYAFQHCLEFGLHWPDLHDTADIVGNAVSSVADLLIAGGIMTPGVKATLRSRAYRAIKSAIRWVCRRPWVATPFWLFMMIVSYRETQKRLFGSWQLGTEPITLDHVITQAVALGALLFSFAMLVHAIYHFRHGYRIVRRKIGWAIDVIDRHKEN